MTTIATDGKSMAGDGLVTNGDLICGWNLQKVFRLDDGRLVGICGSGYNYGAFLEWLKEGGDKPKLSEHFEALILSPDGACVTYDENCNSFPEEVPSACGSGARVAIGAMECGLTPEQAVEIAVKRDIGTGGKITVLHLERALAAVEAA